MGKKSKKAKKKSKCLNCGGKGSFDNGEVECLSCKGKGKV
jgi:DnaJ-class molecular chaperone